MKGNRLLLVAALAACACVAENAVAGGEPCFKNIGYQLDVSRCKVPQMKTLYQMVDVLASLGYNQFQLYTEHTFAYKGCEAAWAEASPMLPDEIRALDAYCAKKGIALVPNQNSFGHMEHWLKHPEFNVLAEAPSAGMPGLWGDISDRPTALCPTDPRSVAFLSNLYDQLFPCFRSKYVNVGCDEVADIAPGKSRSSAEVERRGGVHRVYLDFLLKIHELVKARDHRMMFWGDIILHHPELIPELPEDVIALDWGYEADHPFEKQTSQFEKAGRSFYVCPGTSAWGALTGRVRNMMGNVDNAVTAGAKHGAEGLLLADWGDQGHPNPWLASVPALVYTAARVRGEKLTEDELAARIDKALGCTVGKALVRYGNLYLKGRRPMSNQTIIFRILWRGKAYGPLQEKEPADGKGVLSKECAEAILAEWRAAQKDFDPTNAPEWVKEDMAMMDLLMEAFELRIKGEHHLLMAKVGPRYRALWLKQNRRGGLESSLLQLFSK